MTECPICCAGPLLAVMLGLSGAGLAATFEPMRPFLLLGAVASLGGGFAWRRREEQAACEPGKPCADPRVRRRMRALLWVAAGLALAFGAFPWWSPYVLA